MKKLYEFSALVSYAVVVAADSFEAAEAEIKRMSEDWYRHNADAIAVSDIDLQDVRNPTGPDTLDDEAHLIV